MYLGFKIPRPREVRLPKGTRKSELHPLHGKLSTAIRVQLPSGEFKFMKVKEALRKGYIKAEK